METRAGRPAPDGGGTDRAAPAGDGPSTDRPGRRERRVIGSRPRPRERIAALWRYRELLAGMVRRELKVKYRNSVLGFVWSLLNPLMYLVVFYVAFQVILGAGIPSFPIFLLSGLLVWNLFSTGLAASTGSITGNGGLVGKVSFPREILPLATVGASLVHFFLQAGVLVTVLAVVRWEVGWAWLPLLVPALLVVLVLTVGLGLLLAATNVFVRDTSHLLELALLGWFWMTPIVYGFMVIGVQDDWKTRVFMLNPITPVILVFQRALYNIPSFEASPQQPDAATGASLQALRTTTEILPAWPVGAYLAYLGYAAAIAIVALVAGFVVFGRLEADFAEEL